MYFHELEASENTAHKKKHYREYINWAISLCGWEKLSKSVTIKFHDCKCKLTRQQKIHKVDG